MIDKMASDLGIVRFAQEPLTQYRCRVIYSAIACWIKAIVLDSPIGLQDKELIGVSRRHVLERGHAVLDMLIKMFPDIEEWYNVSEDKDDPVKIIRKRLINHGDLLNAGFETNLALSSVYTCQLNTDLVTIYGKIIEESIRYSGISSIQQINGSKNEVEIERVEDWFQAFLKSACWSHAFPDFRLMQFYNPYSKTKNNMDAWQDNMDGIPDNIILARIKANLNGYSFILIKRKDKLIHIIDLFLQEQGVHIRIMCALRSIAKNNTKATFAKRADHILLHLDAWLPLKERMLLESYAWPVRSIDDKLEWIMDYSIWNHIKPYLEALDISLTEEKHG